MKELEEKTVQSQVKTMQDKNIVDQMQLIITERERRVRELEDELHKLKETLYSSFNNGTLGLSNAAAVAAAREANNESEFMKSRPMSSSRASTAAHHRPESMMLDREITSNRLFIIFGLFKLTKSIRFKLKFYLGFI